MAVIGMCTAWGNSDLAIRALRNHLKICDQILVSVEAHSKSLVKYEDDTLEKVMEFAKEKPVKVIPFMGVAKTCNNPDTAKPPILNYMLRFVNNGDIVMMCDSDEFYSDEAISEIKEHFKQTDWDFTRIHDMFFVKDTEHYVKGSHGRFWRIKQGSEFHPTQNIYPPPVITRTILEDNPMCHLSLLVNEEMRRDYWESEGKTLQVEWWDKVYLPWNVDGDNEHLIHKNYTLTGNKGIWMNSGVEEGPKPSCVFERDFDLPEELI